MFDAEAGLLAYQKKEGRRRAIASVVNIKYAVRSRRTGAMTMRVFATSIAFLIWGCASSAQSDSGGGGGSVHHASPCANHNPELRVKIETNAEKMASICRADGKGDCLYTFSSGKTFVHGEPDLNNDGRTDYLIKDFSGSYGMNEVVHLMGYANCTDGTFVKVLDDFLSDVYVKDTSQGGWRDLEVSRACFDEKIEDVVSRSYSLHFDSAKATYGAPNGERRLEKYCSVYEIALPSSSAKP